MKRIILKTGEEMLLREAKKVDATSVIHHLKLVGDETEFLSFTGTDFNKTLAQEESIIEEHQLAPNRIFLLAEIGDEIVGVSNVDASQKPKMNHFGELGISVLEAHWNKAIGYHMINYIITWAKKNQLLRKLNLEVQDNNLAAIKLYSNLGFELEGRRKRGVLLDGKFYDLILMGLCIN